MSRFSEVKMAFSTSTTFVDFVFHLGYQQIMFPTWLRKLFAKSILHKAWLSGFYGGGILGVLEREKFNEDESIKY